MKPNKREVIKMQPLVWSMIILPTVSKVIKKSHLSDMIGQKLIPKDRFTNAIHTAIS